MPRAGGRRIRFLIVNPTTITAEQPFAVSVRADDRVSHRFLHWGFECDPVACAQREGHHGVAITLRDLEERRDSIRTILAPIARAYYAAVERPCMHPSWYVRATRLRAVLQASHGSSHSTVCAIWAAAMTALYGTTGLADSWTRPSTGHVLDGTPTDEALERLPALREAIAEAEARLERLLGVPALLAA